MALVGHNGCDMYLKLMSMVVCTDEIGNSSRQTQTWTYTLFVDAAAPSFNTVLKTHWFQLMQREYDGRN